MWPATRTVQQMKVFLLEKAMLVLYNCVSVLESLFSLRGYASLHHSCIKLHTEECLGSRWTFYLWRFNRSINLTVKREDGCKLFVQSLEWAGPVVKKSSKCVTSVSSIYLCCSILWIASKRRLNRKGAEHKPNRRQLCPHKILCCHWIPSRFRSSGQTGINLNGF